MLTSETLSGTLMPTDHRSTRRAPWVWRIIRARPRLFASAIVGIVVTAALAVLTDWRLEMRGLIGWDISVGLYVILALEMMVRADVHQIRRHAAAQDEGAVTILVLTVAAALASLLAIVALLGRSSAAATPRHPGDLVLAMLTIGLSWAFIHTMFALHYAHEFYAENGQRGMAFPGAEQEPD